MCISNMHIYLQSVQTYKTKIGFCWIYIVTNIKNQLQYNLIMLPRRRHTTTTSSCYNVMTSGWFRLILDFINLIFLLCFFLVFQYGDFKLLCFQYNDANLFCLQYNNINLMYFFFCLYIGTNEKSHLQYNLIMMPWRRHNITASSCYNVMTPG